MFATERLSVEAERQEHAEEVQQLRALVAAAEREADRLAADCARFNRENLALVAVLLERCPDLSAEMVVELVRRKGG